jgi:hypothetical protein
VRVKVSQILIIDAKLRFTLPFFSKIKVDN